MVKAQRRMEIVFFSSVIVSNLDGKEISSKEMTSAALDHLQSGEEFIQMPHGSIPLNDYKDHNLFSLLYPT